MNYQEQLTLSFLDELQKIAMAMPEKVIGGGIALTVGGLGLNSMLKSRREAQSLPADGGAKTAALRVPKETRKAWSVGSSRKGRRSMSVSTMLRKEKDGTLGGYKLAQTYDLLPHMAPADQEMVQRHSKSSLYKEPTSHTPKRRLLGLLPGKQPSVAELRSHADARVRDAHWTDRHPEVLDPKTAAAYDPPTRLSEEALKSLPARIHPKIKTDKPPTAEDSGTATPSRENTREFAYTEQPRSTTLMNVGTSTYPADRT